MIKIEAAKRLLAQQENHQWIQPIEQKFKTEPKPPTSDRVKPETYNGSPDSIAQELKRVHKELAPAVAALNFFYNKFGKHIGADKQMKRDKVHEKLRDLFKADDKELKKPDSKPKSKSEIKPIGSEPVGTNPIGR